MLNRKRLKALGRTVLVALIVLGGMLLLMSSFPEEQRSAVIPGVAIFGLIGGIVLDLLLSGGFRKKESDPS